MNIFCSKQDLKLDNYTLFKPEIVYSPKNDALETLMEIVQKSLGTIITSLASVNSSEELTPYLIQTNSYVGVEFPDSYSVRLLKSFFKKNSLI